MSIVSRSSSLAALLMLTLSSSAMAGPAAGPVIEVTGGKVEGRYAPASGGVVFEGIPYAQPPVGELRWKDPQPVAPWPGVRPATSYGPSCPQIDGGWNTDIAVGAAEDCLYLNVWNASPPSLGKKPVMVWFHGGANTVGSSIGANGTPEEGYAGHEPPYLGETLASHGVVVVTLNYRLGLLGFIGHPELRQESPHHTSGNYGLLDQIAALTWVRDNIARFGGDPGNVTVFGQSAGAQDTGILLTSPLAKGLIHRVIMESGTPMIDNKRLQTPAQIERLGVTLGQTLGAPATGTIAYLRSLSVEKITAALPEFRKRLDGLILDVGMDGHAVPALSPAVYARHQEARVPMIVGSNRAEPEENFTCEATALAGWHGDIAPTYQYEFSVATDERPADHTAELRFVFGYLKYPDITPALASLSDTMQRYWTNFARTGNPNGPGLAIWRPTSSKARSYIDLGSAGAQPRSGMRAQGCTAYIARVEHEFLRP